MSAASGAEMVDEGTVRSFVKMLHDAAASALKGASDPGVLQLDFLHPNGGSMQTVRFPIGAVDAMADSAISAASNGLNVYVEGRTVDVRASAGRGKANATRGVFAFVDDADFEKGKGGALALTPTWQVESSPGNCHNWLLLDRALTPEQAEPLGRALRAWIGSDSATAKLTQPYRVAGTPNYPDAKKRARGRVVSPTRILSVAGPVWSATDLAGVVPAAPEKASAHVPGGRSGATSSTVEDLAADMGEDRSGRFYDAIRAAVRAGMLPADVEDVFRRYKDGCASKYLLPYDRLAEEIARAWGKVAATVEEEAEAVAACVEPTYPSQAIPVEQARQAAHGAIAAHLAAGCGHKALRIGTGIGKTRAAARAIANDIRRRRDEGDKSAALYLTPTHRLADEVAELFRSEGVTAKAFRGRRALDPEAPDTGQPMCLDLEAVELAVTLNRTVSTSCCKGDHPKTGTKVFCPFFNHCSYQQQFADKPDVWVGAHDLLFKSHDGLGEIGSVTVDEGFWRSGLKIGKRGITLDEFGAGQSYANNFEMMALADIAAWRSVLVKALRRQEETGGVERRHLVAEGIDVATCTMAHKAEWRIKEKVSLWPGMSKAARETALERATISGRVGTFASVWDAARELLEHEDENAVSGRLVLIDKDAGDGFGKTRAVLVHGVQTVKKAWREAPVLLLDATLPALPILQRFFPEVEVVADIEATMPHATVRQVVGAPTSKRKLHAADGERSLNAVRRAILLRWVQSGRVPTLVTAQKETAEWLRTAGLPEGITTGHYGALAGLDGFKDIGLLIAIGRTMPDVFEVETYAGALTGLEPQRTEMPEKGKLRFHDRVPLALRMADGSGYPIQGYHHPDPVAEATRWQVAEGGMLQAVGRARAVNRTASNPVEIVIMNDLAMPLTIDEVVSWDSLPAGREADMIVDGVVLESAPDMATCWPKAWANAKGAENWLARSTDPQSPILDTLYKGLRVCEAGKAASPRPAPFRYKHPGPRQKWRLGWYLPDVVADPFAWLESRLGIELAGAEYLPDEVSGEPTTQAAVEHPGNERSAA